MNKFNEVYKNIIEGKITQSALKVGDKVKLKKEYINNPKEEEIEYIIVNINNKTKRAYIEAQVNKTLKPQELVGLEMIEKYD